MCSKLRAPRVLAATAVAAALTGGSVLGATAVAGAQTDGDRPPAEADRPPGGHGPGLDAAAQAVGLSVDDLRSKLEGDTTIAQVAQQQGVDVQPVITAMVADATAHIDQAVQEGRLTADQANERKANLQDRITRLVNEAPGAVVQEVTRFAPTMRFVGFVVVTVPLLLVVPLPVAAATTSSGLVGAMPLYSAIRISAYGTAAVKVTVTLFAAAAAGWMFAA